MKIALYQPWIYLYGGLEKSLLELVTRSEHEWVVFTGHYEPENTFPGFSEVDVRLLNSTSVKRNFAGTFYSSIQIARQKIPDEDFDAIGVWCDGLGDLITLRNNELPLFNICSTPLRAVFDPVYERQALAGKGTLYRLAYSFFKHSFKTIDRLTWKHFDSVFTTSTEVKNRIIEGGLCTDTDKMVMAYPGIDYKANLNGVKYEPYILLPGRIMWTKNIQLGIKAFMETKLEAPWKLIVTGFLDEKSNDYLKSLKSIAQNQSNIEFIVSPDDETLTSLYQNTAFCLFTPLNEDWGIVPLECMNFGKPVIANASGGPLESIKDEETGILVQPDNIKEWTHAIHRLANDLEMVKKMGINANIRAKTFSWEAFVQSIDSTIPKLVNLNY